MMLSGHVFVSCAPEDGLDDARAIIDRLAHSSSAITFWLAELNLEDMDDPSAQVNEAIQKSSCFLLVLTKAASEIGSRVVDEVKQAARYKKPIVVAAFGDFELPPHIACRPRIAINSAVSGTFEALRTAVLSVGTLEGMLATANNYLADAKYAEKYTRAEKKARIDAEIVELERQVATLEAVLADPAGARERLKQRIELGIERERVPHRALDSETLEAEAWRGPINSPPVAVPGHFQNRFLETKIICDFLRDETKRLIVVTGRGGVGKSALVTRVLRGLQKSERPDDQGAMEAAGIVYLSQITNRHPTFDNLASDLILLLPRNTRDRIWTILESGQTPFTYKTKELIKSFQANAGVGPAVVLLDNMEDLIDHQTFQITDPEIAEFTKQLLESVDSGIKLIMTSRIQPKNFADIAIPAQIHLPLDEGLSSPYAEHVFRTLDVSGYVGLKKNADAVVLKQLQKYTRGIPRAIEAVYAILSADRNTTIDDVLKAPVPDDRVVRVLVGEAYSRLDKIDQSVVQALAIFGTPVPATAVDYILQPWLPQIDAARTLARLVNMLFVRKEGRFYYLHPIDRQHALRMLQQQPISSKLQTRDPTYEFISNKAFAVNSLKEQAADYFADIRIERSEWRSLEDVEPHISEFKLRLELDDDDSAAEILKDLLDFLDGRGAFQLRLTLGAALEHKSRSKGSLKAALWAMVSSHWRMGQIDDALATQQRLVTVAADDPWDLRLQRTNLAIFNLEKGGAVPPWKKLKALSSTFRVRIARLLCTGLHSAR